MVGSWFVTAVRTASSSIATRTSVDTIPIGTAEFVLFALYAGTGGNRLEGHIHWVMAGCCTGQHTKVRHQDIRSQG